MAVPAPAADRAAFQQGTGVVIPGSYLLYNTAHTLLHQALSQNTSHSSSVPCGRGVETLTITLSGLTLPTPVQTMLFAEKPGVETLIDAARTRFPGKLQRPVLTHPTPFFPEEEYRFEPISR